MRKTVERGKPVASKRPQQMRKADSPNSQIAGTYLTLEGGGAASSPSMPDAETATMRAGAADLMIASS
jgi:hypothetical protein